MQEVYIDKILQETERAWLILDLDGNERWYPKSSCEISSDEKVLYVPNWLFFKNDMLN